MLIFTLEDRVGLSQNAQRETVKKQSELVKESRIREAGVLAAAQKSLPGFDQTIEHVERVLRADRHVQTCHARLYGREYFVSCDPGDEGQLKGRHVRFTRRPHAAGYNPRRRAPLSSVC